LAQISPADASDRWPDHVRLADFEMRFICKACRRRAADVRPDWETKRACFKK
jgi:hypothetical protein